MPYNNLIDRSEAGALIPEDVSRDIIQSLPEASAVMSVARRLPNMPTNKQRMPVLSLFPAAYFVNGDTGLKQTTEMNWSNKYLNAEEIAVIVPIPEAVIDDADYDIWGEVRPRIVEAMGKTFDQAVFYGTNAPASWPTHLVGGCTASGHVVDLSDVIAASGDIYDAVMGEAGVLAYVEGDGFMVNGHVAALTMKAKLRGLRDSQKQPIFTRSMQDGTRYELDGEPLIFPRNGSIVPASSLLISGDWDQLVFSIRQDVTYKLLDQAVIQDNTGAIVYNLAQQDMVALRVVMRLAWQLPNPINQINPTEASRYPFALLKP